MKGKHVKKKWHMPWNSVSTRKFAFIYCLLLGTAVIVCAAIMIPTGHIDTATWIHEALDFAKFVVGTGTVIVTLSTTSEVIKFLRGDHTDSSDDSTLNETQEDIEDPKDDI